MEGKNKFILYTEYIETFEALSDEDAGKLIKVIFQYVNDLNPQPEGLIKMVFIPIKQNLKRDLKQWLEAKKKMSEGAKNRWNNKDNNDKSGISKDSVDIAPITTDKEQEAPITTESVNVNDNVNVNVKYKDKTNITNITNKTILDKMEKSKNPFVNYLQSQKVLDENDLFIIPNLENYFESLFKNYDKSNKESWNERYGNVQMAVKYMIPFLKEAIRTDKYNLNNKYGYIVHSIESSLNRKYDFDFKDYLSEEA